MNRLGIALALAVGTFSTFAAPAAERYLVVKLEDLAGEFTHEVMTEEAYASVQEEIRREKRYRSDALAKARKIWRDNPNLKRSFPSDAIGRRRATIVGSTYADRRKASQIAADIETRIKNRTRDERRREDLRLNRNADASKRFRGRESGDRALDRDRKGLQAKARGLFEEQLERLLQQAEAQVPAQQERRKPQPSTEIGIY